MSIYFISDLHLTPRRPKTRALFLHFLKTKALQAEKLFILGDFFEYWIGDDHSNAFYESIFSALFDFKNQHQIPTYFMVGNRDFLVGKHFLLKTGCHLIPDPYVCELYGQRMVLVHGDSLCTQDKVHQIYRKIAYRAPVKKMFLMLPLAFRLFFAEQFRAHRKKLPQTGRPQQRYGITESSAQALLTAKKATCLIHGHTHLAGIHTLGTDQKRIVLGEWLDDSAIVLNLSQDADHQAKFTLETIFQP